MREKYLDVNGWQVRFSSAGQVGPALILLHGLGASLESWWYNLETLGRQFRVYAPDLLYFGKSAKPPSVPTPEDFDRFVLGFMDAVGVERAVLLGHSMGGMISTKLVLDHPDRFAGLVLVSPAGFGRELVWWLRLRTLFPLNINTEGNPPPWLKEFGLRQMFYDPRKVDDDFLEAVIQVAQTPGLLPAYQNVIRVGVDWRGIKPDVLQAVRDQAHRIETPTLVIWGKQDRILPVSHARVVGERIRHATVHLLDRCGHAPMIEHPEQFNALVTAFVREHALAHA
jgi:4,5:9,10-diseco-3-hydroxy-5,9,17-trioxoandrosta-1(10),2-diene-4-oate hydrolase